MDTAAWAVLAFVTLTDQSRKFNTLCPKCHSEFEQVDPQICSISGILHAPLRTNHVSHGRQAPSPHQARSLSRLLRHLFDAGEFQHTKEHPVPERFKQMTFKMSSKFK